MSNVCRWDHNVDDHARAVDTDAAQAKRDAEHGSHLIAPNVGQNTVEVWQIKSGGGWVRHNLCSLLYHLHCQENCELTRTIAFSRFCVCIVIYVQAIMVMVADMCAVIAYQESVG